MGTVWQDVRYALRMLGKAPGFTAIALITLALGIGANTIMFGVVNAVLLRPPNVKDPDRVIACYTRREGSSYRRVSYPQYLDMRDHNPVFQELMAYNVRLAVLEQGEIAKRGLAAFASANYFSTLGVTPIRGRVFLPEEEQLGTEPVIVLSHQAWLRQGADPDIVGKPVRVNAKPFHVVGVMPEGFTGPALAGPDFWMPLGAYSLLTDRPGSTVAESYPALTLVGRLRPGLSLAVAQNRLEPLAARLAQEFPDRWKDLTFHLDRLPRANIWTGPDDRRGLLPYGLFLMGVSAIVLLIACLNMASMYLVRGAARQREIAIRMAAGGSRWRIVRQLLVESLLLALLGGFLGLVLAEGGAKVLNASITMVVASFYEVTHGFKVVLDVRVLLATVAFCGLATVLSGLRPALRLSRRPIFGDLKESRGTTARPTRQTRRLVPVGFSVACQMALSVVLVMAAGLFARSAIKAARATPGYGLEGKLLVRVDPRAAGYDQARGQQMCERLVSHLGAMPGVQAAGVSTSMLFELTPTDYQISERGRDADTNTPIDRRVGFALRNRVGGDYFQAMGLSLLQGRYFTPQESGSNAHVAIIDEPLANRLRPDGRAVGCLISGCGEGIWEVVGIVPGVRNSVFDEEPQAHVYQPFVYNPDSFLGYIHLRLTGADPGAQAALLQRIPKEIRAVHPSVPVLSLVTLSECYHNSLPMWLARISAGLAVTFGTMALFLAALGIYGVKGYLVASRTPEIGIRMALGATRRSILALVLREGAALTLAGLSVGMLLAVGVARVMSSALCGISPTDPLSIAATLTLLGTVSLLASYIPARRAARVDPMAALRYE